MNNLSLHVATWVFDSKPCQIFSSHDANNLHDKKMKEDVIEV